MDVSTYYEDKGIEVENIPEELKSRNQWVAWKKQARGNGKVAKIPVCPHTGENASVSDPSTWGSYNDALNYFHHHPSATDGVGFVFSESDPFVGIDIDDCLNPENLALTNEAENLLNRFNSYTEISPSGKGIHIYLKHNSMLEGLRHGNVEIYSQKRFFTVTGKSVGSNTDIRESDAVADLIHELKKGSNKTEQPDFNKIIELLTKKFGQKFEALWGGNMEDYPSPSEADLALCRMLAGVTQNNFSKIDALFQLSGLYRTKWDRNEYKNSTISKAIQSSGQSLSKKAPYYNLTDLGNAERFAEQHRGTIAWCGEWKYWLIWDGRRWQRDDRLAAMQLAKQTVRSICDEAAQAGDDDRIKLLKHAVKSESEPSVRAMLATAKSESGMSIISEELDTHNWLLNCYNGVLDLKSGELLSHSPEYFLTKLVQVDFQPEATCPIWLKFLDDIMGGNREMISFLQRAIGYALTGETSEQCFFMLYGTGKNGKTTFLEPVNIILNDYARQSPTETFLAIRKKGANNDVARLKGARFVTASEPEAGQRFAETLLKQVTGGDMVTARFLHQEFFDFKPNFKLFLNTNHKPKVNSGDTAMWRRIILIPFEVTIPEHERDLQLPEKLKNELEGILAWAVQGCLEWQRNGLGIPLHVKMATDEYAKEMDSFVRFLEDQCDMAAALKTGNKELFHNYLVWCQDEGEPPLNKTMFGKKLSEKGFVSYKDRSGRGWKGIGLIFDNQFSSAPPSILPGRGPVSP